MFKEKMLFPLAMVFMLALFLLPMSSGQIYATDEGSEENLEASDALQQQQDSPVDYKSRGNSLLKKGQIDDAITDLNKAVELNPKDAGAYYYRGECIL
jgi:tetratricopeptide (TPR) repeat protein